ncbi:MAG: hypothetical protein M1814_001138 [Vezdaea aestivalis]|nr:MAG: hypothetical protein M1814_001138 [Vezdaea aestivalis]
MSTFQTSNSSTTKRKEHHAHPPFEVVESSRPDWVDQPWSISKTRAPDWELGSGANDGGESLGCKHVIIDPYEEGRPAGFNYKLLISAIVPRPIGFMSTVAKDGSSTNLAPMSYMNMMCHDPPIFVVGFSGGIDNPKDTLRNLVESRECVINIISEHFLESANATSIDAPHGVSEWAVSGLHPAASQVVQPSRVKESVFSVEGVLVETKEFESKASPGTKSGAMATIEGVRFWVREDAINEERNLVDPTMKTNAKLVDADFEAYESFRGHYVWENYLGGGTPSAGLG